MTPNSQGPIALALFKRVDDYSNLIRDGRVTPQNALEKSTPIVVFCENFFSQFFESLGQEITGFGPSARADAIEIRKSLLREAGNERNKASAALVAQFEKFSDYWEDLGGGYIKSIPDYVNFHKRYIPKLLNHIAKWAESGGWADLALSSKEARARYLKAVPGLVVDA